MDFRCILLFEGRAVPSEEKFMVKYRTVHSGKFLSTVFTVDICMSLVEISIACVTYF